MWWYILTDREFCTLYHDDVHFSKFKFFASFSLLLYDVNRFRLIFLYEFKLNQSAAETARKINQASGNDNVNERTARRWFSKFRSGDFSLEDEPEAVDLR